MPSPLPLLGSIGLVVLCLPAQTILHEWRGATRLGGFGSRLANVGDIDGDGVPDVGVGAPFASLNGNTQSGQFLVFSGRTGATLFSVAGFRSFDLVGRSVAGLGDINSDSRDDFAIAGSVGQWGTQVYCGRTRALLATIALRGFVAGPGDLDGDGRGEIFVGDTDAIVSPFSYAGRAEVLSFGFSSEPPYRLSRGQDGRAPFDLTTNIVYAYQGTFNGQGRGYVKTGQDLDADGTPDLLLGAPGVWPFAGASGVFAHSGADGQLLFRLTPPAGSDSFPWDMAGVGDVNADGFDDVAVSDQGPRLLQPYFHVTVFAGPTGAKLFTLQSPTASPRIGDNLAAPGDVDGDGHDDILTGGSSGNGQVLLISGRDQSLLFDLQGTAAVFLGSGTGETGDLNGDDFPDFAAGGADFQTLVGIVRVYSGAPDGVTAFGVGCPDERNIIPRIGASHVPAVGATDFAINLSRARSGIDVLLALGTSNQSWRGMPLPAPLPALGPNDCPLLVAPDTLVPLRTNGTVPDKGWMSFVVPIPNDPSLRGTDLFAQWLLIDGIADAQPRDRSVSVTRALHIVVQ